MCSVVGYVGKGYSKKYILDGLARLEYRGYDSSGFACIQDKRLRYVKVEGRLTNLIKRLNESPLDGHIGVGHTRWSTHGVPSSDNAHPHFDCHKTLAIVHNGIIENHHELRKELVEAGHVFSSETDTEVAAHLFELFLISHKTVKAAVVDLVNRLEGAYAFVAFTQEDPDTLIVVRKRSPLCIGIGDDEMFVASDPLAFAHQTNKVMVVPDDSFAFVKKDAVEVYDFEGKPLPLSVQTIDLEWHAAEKQGYEHFMLKEIYEQKAAIHATVSFLRSISLRVWDYIGIDEKDIDDIQGITIVGCGTSWHAARLAQFFFEYTALVPTRVHLASEFRYMPFFPDKKSLYIVVSQSGETADTLEALQLIKSMNLKTLAVTNVASSTMVREADGFLLTQAGQEIAVASTKAFSTQIAVLFWLSYRLACEKRILNSSCMQGVEEELLVVAQVLENSIENYKFDIIQHHARKYAKYKKYIFLGRHLSYPFALEAALKLKEISYIFAQCYSAGELKHGPLALVDAETPLVIFSHQDPVIYQKIVANAQEVKARGGHLIVFVFEGQEELKSLADLVFEFPRVHKLLGPLAMTGLMQFFVYAIAKELECSIDKPRNLAKSVTVE